MKNILLAMLTVGFLMFSGISCAGVVKQANAAPISNTPFVTEENYIGMSAKEVMKKIGTPTDVGKCFIRLPTAPKNLSAQLMVTGDAATWRHSGWEEENSWKSILKLCAIFGTVVSQQMDVTDRKFIEGERVYRIGFTDFILLREVIEAGPKKDGIDGVYVLKPGEMEI